MALNNNALIDETYFNTMWPGSAIDSTKLENYINAISTAFERFCNRKLKERSFTYVLAEEDAQTNTYYVPEYTIFDAPVKNLFWFPTYPVSAITYFEISGTVVTAATGYTADTGYILYDKTGRLVYDYGFDYDYRQNVKVKWTGGYSATSIEMSHLKYLTFLVIKDVIKNESLNTTMQSETIGMYSYKTMPTYFLKSLQGLSPEVFTALAKYRREAIG